MRQQSFESKCAEQNVRHLESVIWREVNPILNKRAQQALATCYFTMIMEGDRVGAAKMSPSFGWLGLSVVRLGKDDLPTPAVRRRVFGRGRLPGYVRGHRGADGGGSGGIVWGGGAIRGREARAACLDDGLPGEVGRNILRVMKTYLSQSGTPNR